MSEKFWDYLYYAPSFTVYTDNNPLTYILTSAKLNATGHRWVAELADYNFKIKYRPGRNNADADVLSRLPLNSDDYMAQCTSEVSADHISATANTVMARTSVFCPWMTVIKMSISCSDDGTTSTQHISKQELKAAQLADDIIGPILRHVTSGRRSDRRDRIEEHPVTHSFSPVPFQQLAPKDMPRVQHWGRVTRIALMRDA